MAKTAVGRLWQQTFERFSADVHPEILWQLSFIYNALDCGLTWMPADSIWRFVSVPVVREDDERQWIKISDLGELVPLVQAATKGRRESFTLSQTGGGIIDAYDSLSVWLPQSMSSMAEWQLTRIVATMSTVVLTDQRPMLEPRSPKTPWPRQRNLSCPPCSKSY
jgi:hypothetical protein